MPPKIPFIHYIDQILRDIRGNTLTIPSMNAQLSEMISVSDINAINSKSTSNSFSSIQDRAFAEDSTIRLQNIMDDKINSDRDQQLTFTRDFTKLQDCLVLELFSPDSNQNPNFSKSRDQKLFRDTVSSAKGLLNMIPGVSSAVEAVEETVKSIVPDSIKNLTGKLMDSATSSKAFTEATQKDFENLNKNFYTSSRDGNHSVEIMLPMPQGGLMDNHAHQITGVSMNPVGPILGAAALVASAVTGMASAMTNSAGGSGNSTKKAYNSSGQSLPVYALQALQLQARKALNPAQEMLYQSPIARQFQFTIQFSPQDKQEADNFMKIVDMLKQHSYPTLDFDATLYNFPGTLKFYFKTNGKKNEKLPRSYFPCFIKSVQITYMSAGEGFYSHFYDGNPTSINLTLDISESKLLARNDLDNSLSQEQGLTKDLLNFGGVLDAEAIIEENTVNNTRP